MLEVCFPGLLIAGLLCRTLNHILILENMYDMYILSLATAYILLALVEESSTSLNSGQLGICRTRHDFTENTSSSSPRKSSSKSFELFNLVLFFIERKLQ